MARRIDGYLRSLISEEKFDFYSVVRDFTDAEVAPHILEWERNHVLVPDECITKMSKLGLFGLSIAESYGSAIAIDVDMTTAAPSGKGR